MEIRRHVGICNENALVFPAANKMETRSHVGKCNGNALADPGKLRYCWVNKDTRMWLSPPTFRKQINTVFSIAFVECKCNGNTLACCTRLANACHVGKCNGNVLAHPIVNAMEIRWHVGKCNENALVVPAANSMETCSWCGGSEWLRSPQWEILVRTLFPKIV